MGICKKKNIVLNFGLHKTVFFSYFFLFSIYKMVDMMDIYKSLNIGIRTAMKNLEMLKFVPDHLKKRVSIHLKKNDLAC